MDTTSKQHLVIARDFYRAGEYEAARPHLEAVLAHHDGFADVHNMLGVVEFEAGHIEAAQVAFERAVALNPHYTEAALNLAVVYNELGRYQDAQVAYLQAQGDREGQSLDRLNHFVRGKLANMHADLGDAYAGVGLLDHAIIEYRKALSLSPTFVDIRTKLGTTLRDLGRLVEALDELIGVRESNPSYVPGRVQLGVTLWRANRIEAARLEWRQASALDPNNRSCRVYLKMTDTTDHGLETTFAPHALNDDGTD